MSDLFGAIRTILERDLNESNLDHYSILGVSRDANVESIKAALRHSASLWNASNSKVSPLLAQQIAGLLKQSQAVLLDPAKREAYDQKVGRSDTADQLAVATVTTALADESKKSSSIDDKKQSVESKRKVAKIYPAGDPLAPFDPTQLDPARWGEGEARYTFGSVEERWQQLETLVLVGFESPQAVDESKTSFGLHQANLSAPLAASTPSPMSSAARVEMLKRKRQKNQAMTFGGILLAALVFLGFAAYRLYVNQAQQALAEATKNEPKKPQANGQVKGDAKSGLKIATAPPVRSNLPTLGGGGDSKGGEDSKMPSPFGDDMAGDSSMASNPMADKPNPDSPAPVPTPPAPTTPEPTPEPTKPVEPTMTPPSPEKPMETMGEMTPQNKKDWIAAMKDGREALDKADFAKFQASMEKATALAAAGEMLDKQKRLDQLGQLYEIAFKAMKEARGKMRGTESLSYGKNQISIVEVRDDYLVIRMAGKNERHAWNKLPMGVALAMADLSLSDSEPIDIAARGVYLAMSPNKNELTEKKMKEFFEKSLGKGEIRKDLLQALSDKYE